VTPSRRRLGLLALAVLLCQVGYLFLTSTCKWTEFPQLEKRIDELAEAFRAGQVHLLQEPNPELLRRANPFDPANQAFWYWDTSLYKGHYYAYWGPVPAIGLAIFKTAFRISRPLGDYVPVLALVTLQLIAGAILLERVARRLFPETPDLCVAAAIVVFAFANPTPFILDRPAIYEAAIVGGQAFVLLGIALAFEAICQVDRRRASNLLAAAAGLSFGLAIGCRISLAPAIAALCLALTVVVWRRADGQRWRRFAETSLSAGAPLALSVGALLLYNRVRFDHWTEFGARYQLSWVNFNWHTSYIWPNIYSYLLRPGQLSCRFPFVTAPFEMSPAVAFPAGFRLPEGYYIYEALMGLLVAAPLAWLGPAAFIGPARSAAEASGETRATLGLRRALGVLLVIAGTITALPILGPNSATMRYQGDFAPALVMLSFVGAWTLERMMAPRTRAARWAFRVPLIALAVLTLLIGTALGFTGYYKVFDIANPSLMAKLRATLHVCR